MKYYSIHKLFYLIIQSVLVLSLLSAQTQLGSDIDGESAGDQSGVSVSMDSDGSHVAIGARYNAAGGSNQGHVRVFEYSSGSWSQVGSDIDGEANTDYSGYSVSLDLDGSHVVIGAYQNDGNGSGAGHVRVYEYSGSSWSQVGADIDGEAAGDGSGISVSIDSDGSHVAIGAPWNDGNGSNSGHVRVYEYSGSSWSQVGADIDGEAAGDQSGISVSIDSDGSHVAFAAKNNDDGGGNSGHVRIFEYDGSAWIQVGSDIDGDAAGDYSGGSISIDSDGSHVAIGAENKNSNTGQVRVFEYSGATWSQLGSDIDGVAAGDYFGTSVSIDSDGSHLVVGGKGNDDGSGNAGHSRLYSYSGSSWVQIGNDVYGESASDYSGFSVSIDSDGSHVAISAPYNNGNGSNAGHVRVFEFESSGITVSISDSITSELGDTASFTVVLDSEPTGDVVIPISSSDITEGTVSPDTLTFTSSNWNTAQTVTVTGVDDNFGDGDIAYIVALAAATSSDANYNGVDADDVSMTNTDNDTAGFTVSYSNNLITSETGGTASFTVVLDSEPTGDVVIPISSSDVTEGIVSPDTLTFTAANWNATQTVTITGVNDDVDDGDITYTIIIGSAISSDINYNGSNSSESITNTDDDTAGYTISISDSITSELGDTASFTVVLNSEPTGDVVIPISSSDITEGIVSPDTLTFTAANWNTAQTVTVTGVDDNETDGDITYSITLSAANSVDGNYQGLDPDDLNVINEDFEPIITVLLTTIDFDSVVVFGDSSLTITVGNTGNDNLVIDSVSVSSIIFSMNTISYPITLTSAEDSVFTITFSPQDTIEYTANLVIFSNDPDSSSYQVSLLGTGYNAPPNIIEIDEPDSVSSGDNVVIDITVSDDDSITTVVLNYFVGGDTSMYAVLADDPDGDGTFSAEIDSSAIGLTGVAYFVAVSDNFGNTSNSDTVSIITQFDDNVLNTAIGGSAYADGIPKSKWRLISVPTNLDESSVSNTIQDELNQSSSDDTWRLYEDSGNTTWIEAESFVLGQGYWIQQRVENEIDFSTGSGQSVDLLGFTINIPSGWSLIGNPYPFELETTFIAEEVYGPLTYGVSDIESWDAESNVLSPWQGYAIYNRTADSVALNINPLESGGGALLKEADVDDGWKIVISIDNGEYGDIYNAIGRSSFASEQYDFYDNPEPSRLDKYVSLSMDRSDWGVKSLFTTDIRSLDVLNGIWKMNLDIGNVQGPFIITSEQLGTLPDGQIAILLDHIEHQFYELLNGQDILVTKASEQFSYPMSVIVGNPEFVEAAAKSILTSIPDKFALHQNYPNPFNPTTNISFSLPKPSIVEIKIYNILGQSVVTLTSDWYNLGHHSLQWNGRDMRGEQVGTGIYFYSLETTDFRQVKKLMFLK